VQAWLDATGSAGRVATIPLFAYEDVPSLDSGEPLEERREVLFVGGFAHAPNADGVAWFAREVWPLVRAKHPEYRLSLVGSDPTDEISALAAEDVFVTGSLTEPALIARYGLARVAIAPMRFGAGLKGKVLESMRFGVPCVTTSVGAQGLSEATFLRVTDEAPAMAAHIVELIEDSEAWLRIARDAQAFVRERYSVATVWNTLAEVMDPTPYPDVAARRERIAMNVRHSATIAASKPEITTT
jgi:glycosyltransferase involved in cell wall biosynthesis